MGESPARAARTYAALDAITERHAIGGTRSDTASGVWPGRPPPIPDRSASRETELDGRSIAVVAGILGTLLTIIFNVFLIGVLLKKLAWVLS